MTSIELCIQNSVVVIYCRVQVCIVFLEKRTYNRFNQTNTMPFTHIDHQTVSYPIWSGIGIPPPSLFCR